LWQSGKHCHEYAEPATSEQDEHIETAVGTDNYEEVIDIPQVWNGKPPGFWAVKAYQEHRDT
jgi:hypothetical protein